MNIHLRAYWFADTTVHLPYLNFILAIHYLSQVLPKCPKVLAAIDMCSNQLHGGQHISTTLEAKIYLAARSMPYQCLHQGTQNLTNHTISFSLI
jgi:hypothetical protein